MTLTEFLLARITEDEDDARSACRARETRRGDQWEVRQRVYSDEVSIVGAAREARVCDAPRGARHIARHDPARVLAECEAKRKMVLELDGRLEHAPDGGVWFDLLTYLSWPYADHPDYDEAWRP